MSRVVHRQILSQKDPVRFRQVTLKKNAMMTTLGHRQRWTLEQRQRWNAGTTTFMTLEQRQLRNAGTSTPFFHAGTVTLEQRHITR